MRTFLALLFLVLLPSAGAHTSAQVLPDPLPRRGFVGALVSPGPDGLVVVGVDPETAAAAGGLRPDDVLAEAAGTPLSDFDMYAAVVRRHMVGDSLTLRVLRDDASIRVPLVLGERPRESAPDFDVLYTAVEAEGALRRVLVTRPRHPGQHPAVLLLGGIGCYSLDNPPENHPYRFLLADLTRRGFVTMRVEKSGMGDSEGAPCAEVDFDVEVAGYAAAAQAARRYPFVDGDRLFLLGHSIGALSAPVVAGRVAGVAGVVAISGGAVPWAEHELRNFRRQLELGGAPPDAVDLAAATRARCLHALYVEGKAPDEIRAEEPACEMSFPAHYTYLQDLSALPLARLWMEVEAPVLAVYPTSDFLVAEDEVRRIAEVVNRARPGHATFVALPGVDHYFNAAPTQQASFSREQAQEQGVFAPDALAPITGWLARQAGLDPP